MKKLSLEQIPDLNNDKCFECGKKLTPDNKSAWINYAVVDGKQVGVSLCLFCNEAEFRMYRDGGEKIGDEIVPSKTKEQCIKEMREEGITDEILKAMEDAQLEIKQ